MSIPVEARPIVDTLFSGVRAALGDNLVGFYLRGSIALGAFNPETSDVDVLAVTERPLSDAEFAALTALHERIPARENEYGRYYEISYVDRTSVKHFATGERRHATVGADWPFEHTEHRDNFIFELWIVREHGITVFGPPPKRLIAAITPDNLRSTAANELRWAEANVPPEFLATREYQAFAVETMCRGLYTLQVGTVATKAQAVVWALEMFPQPWHALVAWSQVHRADKTEDSTRIPDVMAFVRWAHAQTQSR